MSEHLNLNQYPHDNNFTIYECEFLIFELLRQCGIFCFFILVLPVSSYINTTLVQWSAVRVDVDCTVLLTYCPVTRPFSTHIHRVRESVQNIGIFVVGYPVSTYIHKSTVKLKIKCYHGEHV